jgi:hypothetical protein
MRRTFSMPSSFSCSSAFFGVILPRANPRNPVGSERISCS